MLDEHSLLLACSLRPHGQLKDVYEGQTMMAQNFEAVVLLDFMVSFPAPLVPLPYPKLENRARAVVGLGRVCSHANSNGVGI